MPKACDTHPAARPHDLIPSGLLMAHQFNNTPWGTRAQDRPDAVRVVIVDPESRFCIVCGDEFFRRYPSGRLKTPKRWSRALLLRQGMLRRVPRADVEGGSEESVGGRVLAALSCEFGARAGQPTLRHAPPTKFVSVSPAPLPSRLNRMVTRG